MIAKLPLVLMLSDEPRSARAVKLLLGDWGYRVAIGSMSDPISLSDRRSEHAVAILTDLVQAGWEHGLEQAIAVRQHVAAQLPILILCPHELPKMMRALPHGVTALEKPVEPIKLQEWLHALQLESAQAS